MNRLLLIAALATYLAGVVLGCTHPGADGGSDRVPWWSIIPGAERPRTVSPAPSPGCIAGVEVRPSIAAPKLRSTLQGSWDENWFASPTLVDLDRDGRLDVVAARHSVLYAWRHDGTPLWKTAFAHSAGSSPEHGDRRMWPSAAAGDFDGDGDVELAVASDIRGTPAVNVALYDHTGALLPGWPVKFGDKEVRSLAVADVTGDGRSEVLVNKTGPGPSTAVYSLDGAMMPGWPQVSVSCNPPAPAQPCLDYGGYHQNIGAADLDGDGIEDVVSSYDLIRFGLFRGDGTPFPSADVFARDRVVTSIPAYHDPALARQGWGTGDRSEFTDSPPSIGDIDGDGSPEIVLAGNHEHSDSTASRGYSLFVFNPDGTRAAGWEWPKDTGAPLRTDDPGNNVVLTLPSPALGNLDDDPRPEIVFPGFDGRMYAFDGDGRELWSFRFGSAQPYVGGSEPILVDLDGDARAEVLFTTWTSGAPNEPEALPVLIVLAHDGRLLHRVGLSGRGSMAAPTAGDLDGDGQLELVLSLKDAVGGGMGGVQIWDLPGSSTGCAPWPTGRGNMRRTGVADL